MILTQAGNGAAMSLLPAWCAALSQSASLEADSAWQWPNDHAVVVWTRDRIDELHVKVPQDGTPDGLDLQVGKVGA